MIENAKRGLILEFSLEDIRKKIKREKVITERRSKIHDEKRKEKKIKKQINKDMNALKDSSKKDSDDTIDNIKDLSQLMEIYHKTVSRGKKQRIKKRIRKLGFIPESLDFSQKNKNIAYAKKNVEDNKVNNYVVQKVDLGYKNKPNNLKENGRKMLNQKRERGSKSLTKV